MEPVRNQIDSRIQLTVTCLICTGLEIGFQKITTRRIIHLCYGKDNYRKELEMSKDFGG